MLDIEFFSGTGASFFRCCSSSAVEGRQSTLFMTSVVLNSPAPF